MSPNGLQIPEEAEGLDHPAGSPPADAYSGLLIMTPLTGPHISNEYVL